MDTEQHVTNISKQFRQKAGLPERKNDKPGVDSGDPAPELHNYHEPEGGYGGAGETEPETGGSVDEKLVEKQQEGEERSAKSGQGVTTPGGEEASTSTEATEEGMDAASKTAKKTASKKSSK